MVQVHGHYDERFADLPRLLSEFIEAGEEVGASICVNVDGKDVVDIWAGHDSEDRSREWKEDTIVNVYSTTKTVSSLAMLMLVDRGLVDLDDPVAKHWPEFAANGKEKVLIKHIISHTSGVCGWDKPITVEDIYDFDKSSAMLAEQAPFWEPGTASGYHSISMGHLIGSVVKRVTGKPLKQFVAEEIAGPLKADFQIGCKEADWDRTATLIPPPPNPLMAQMDPNSIPGKTFGNPPMDAKRSATPGWRNADIGAANGHANARSVVRMLSPISLGGSAPGLEEPLLSQKTIDKIFVQQSKGADLAIGFPLKFWTGYGASDPDTAVGWMAEGRVCWWAGWGGSNIVMDLDRKMTFSYVMNKMNNDTLGGGRTHTYTRAAWKALGVPLPDLPVPAKA